MDWQNFLSFIAQISGSLSAWPTIFSNIAAFAVVFLTRNLIHRWYVTLVGMDNSIITAASWLFMLSVYALIYKAVFACFKGVANYKASRLKEKEKVTQNERITKDIQALSKQEIAILKFVLAQHSHVAWLPCSCTPIILLAKKGLISIFSKNSKNIPTHSRYYEFGSNALLFTIPDNVRKIIDDMPQEFHKKWRKIKPESSLEECQ